PCPYAGRIVGLHAAAGDTVTAGQALLSVAEAGAGGAGQSDAGAAEGPAQSGAMASGDEPAAAGDESSGGANLIGYGTSEPKARSSKERSFGRKTTASAAAEPGPTSAVSGPPSDQQVSPVSSPL